MKFFLATFCLFLAAAPAMAQATPKPRDPILAGDKQSLWLILPSDDGKSFDVMVRPSGEKWRPLAQKLSGNVALAAAMDGSLHVIFREPLGHGTFQANSPRMIPLPTPSAPSWPDGAVPLALCAADKLGATTQPSLVALVPGTPKSSTTSRAASQTSTLEAIPSVTSAPATGTANTEGIRPQLFQWTDGKWQATFGDDSIAKPYDRIMITATTGYLYRLVTTPGGNELSMRDFVIWNSFSSRWFQVPMEKELASAAPLALMTLANKPAVVAAIPAGKGKIRVSLFILEDDRHFSVSPLRAGKVPYEWDSSGPPSASPIGDQFELVWRQDGKLMDATCSLAGQMAEPAEIPLSKTDVDARAQQLYMYFLTGVFVVILVLLAIGPTLRPKPFELPPQAAPANLLKRALAAMIDFIPWSTIAAIAMGFSVEEMKAILGGDQGLTERHVYLQVLSQSMYVVYCIITEASMGATLGKRLLRLRVLEDEGKRPGLRSVVMRNLMKTIELQPINLFIVPGSLPLLLLAPLMTAHRMRLGDMLGRTVVVETRPIPTPPPAE